MVSVDMEIECENVHFDGAADFSSRRLFYEVSPFGEYPQRFRGFQRVKMVLSYSNVSNLKTVARRTQKMPRRQKHRG